MSVLVFWNCSIECNVDACRFVDLVSAATFTRLAGLELFKYRVSRDCIICLLKDVMNNRFGAKGGRGKICVAHIILFQLI